MFTKDKILDCGEIKSAADFKLGTGSPFYLMFVPKSADGDSVVIATGKCSASKNEKDIPFMVGVWNPVTVVFLKVTSEILGKFRIFYGIE